MRVQKTANLVLAASLILSFVLPLTASAAPAITRTASLTAVSPTYTDSFPFTSTQTNATVFINLAQGTTWTGLTATVGVGPSGSVSFQLTDPNGIVQRTSLAVGSPGTVEVTNPISGQWVLTITSTAAIASGSQVPIQINVIGSTFVAQPTTTTTSTSGGGGTMDWTFYILLIAVVIAAAVILAFVFVFRGRESPPAPPPAGAMPPPMTAPPSGGTTVREAGTQVMQRGTMTYFGSLDLPSGQTIPITQMTQDFGRSDFEPVVPKDVSSIISRRHFRISFSSRDKTFYIEDIGSTNGTMLNGSDIRGKGKVPLKTGDTVAPADIINLKFKG